MEKKWLVYPYDSGAQLYSDNVPRGEEEALQQAKDFMSKGALRIDMQAVINEEAAQ